MRDENIVEQFEESGYTVKIYPDFDPQNPRKDYDPLGTMVHWHRRYDLGDRKLNEQEEKALRRGGFKLLERYLRITQGAVCVLPLSLLDHSGLHMWVGGGPHWSDSAGWDSGTVGFIYVTKDQLEKFGTPADKAEQQLNAEVETYDQYLRGDVYGYVIEDEDGEHVDSCWGFYGSDYVREEARTQAKVSRKYWTEQEVKIDRMYAL